MGTEAVLGAPVSGVNQPQGPGKVVAALTEIGKCTHPAGRFMPVSYLTSPAASRGNHCQNLLVLAEKLRKICRYSQEADPPTQVYGTSRKCQASPVRALA